MKSKKKKEISKNKILIHSKPSFGYYLLIIIFPFLFLLIDDLDKPFQQPWGVNSSSLVILLFLGIPLILLLTKKETAVYIDRIEINQKLIRRTKRYFFSTLDRWEYVDYYAPKIGQQRYISLTFGKKKVSIHSLESNSFEILRSFLTEHHGDIEIKSVSLGDRIWNFFKNKSKSKNH